MEGMEALDWSRLHWRLVRGKVDDYMYYPAMHQHLLPVERKRTSSFDLLQDALSAIPLGECYVMLGDLWGLMHVWGPRQWMMMNGGMKGALMDMES